jgi:nuclear GTP-binding protein
MAFPENSWESSEACCVCYWCLQMDNKYTVLLKEKKLPMALLEDPTAKKEGRQSRSHLLATQPFKETFGAKQTRKRPRIAAESYQELLDTAQETNQA